MICRKMPVIKLHTKRITTTLKKTFKLNLYLIKTNKPKPAFVINPEINDAKLNKLLEYN